MLQDGYLPWMQGVGLARGDRRDYQWDCCNELLQAHHVQLEAGMPSSQGICLRKEYGIDDFQGLEDYSLVSVFVSLHLAFQWLVNMVVRYKSDWACMSGQQYSYGGLYVPIAPQHQTSQP